MYHDIREKPLNFMDVQAEDFKKHLDWLKSDGWQTLSMEEFIGYVERGENFPKKSLLLTFDDGYLGIYKYAAPEQLKKLAKNPLFSIGCTQ